VLKEAEAVSIGSREFPPQKTTPGFATVKLNVLDPLLAPRAVPVPDEPPLTVLKVAI
jgi:hypothetical protein